MKINKTKNLCLCIASIKHFGMIMAVLLLQFFPVAIYSPFDTFFGKDLFFGVFPKENYFLGKPLVTFIRVSLW